MIKRYLLVLFLIGLAMQFFGQQARYLRPSLNLGENYTLESIQKALERQFYDLTKSRSHLEFVWKTEGLASTHFSFRQMLQDVPVYQGGVKVILDKQGKVRAILENLQPIPAQILPGFKRSLSELYDRIGETYGAYELKSEQMFYPDRGKLRAVYKVLGYAHGPVYSFEVLIDANTGEEIAWKNLDLHLRPAGLYGTEGDTSGQGRVFIPNPCTRAQVNYGDLFIDSMDIHKPLFEAFMDTVNLLDICIEEDSFRLKGPYVEIKDLEAPFVKPVASKDGNFFFKRDEYGFEQVMAYYHIDRFQRKIRSLGYQNLSMGPLWVDAEGTYADNSVTMIKDSMPVLLFGLGGVDDAEDADVIIHEYGHALSFYATRGRAANGNLERVGLEEGIGDYLAAIYSQDLGYDNWFSLFNWDGHNEFWSGRLANSSASYPPQDTTIYTLGGIWAASILELRSRIGSSKVDSLFFEEMYMNSPTTGLQQAAQLFILADSLLFGGLHSEEIRFTFCERGLLPEISGNCAVVSQQPLRDLPNISIFPNPGAGHFTLDLNTDRPSLTCVIHNNFGQEVFNQKVFPGKNFLALPHLASGIYFLQIFEGSNFLTSQKLLIHPKN